jgi:hypothetical protein
MLAVEALKLQPRAATSRIPRAKAMSRLCVRIPVSPLFNSNRLGEAEGVAQTLALLDYTIHRFDCDYYGASPRPGAAPKG